MTTTAMATIAAGTITSLPGHRPICRAARSNASVATATATLRRAVGAATGGTPSAGSRGSDKRHPGGVQGDTDAPGERQQTHGGTQQRGVDAPSASKPTDDAEQDAVGTALRPWRVNEPWCRGRGCTGRGGLSHVVNRRAAPPPWVLVVSRISRAGIRGITDGHRGDLSLR